MDRHDFPDVFAWVEENSDPDPEYDPDDMDHIWWEEIVQQDLEGSEIQHHIHPDVAWVGMYEIEKKGGRFYASCCECGERFVSGADETARGRAQRHILRGCKPLPKTKPTPDECPF